MEITDQTRYIAVGIAVASLVIYVVCHLGYLPYTSPWYARRFHEYYGAMARAVAARDCAAVAAAETYLEDPRLLDYIVTTQIDEATYPMAAVKVDFQC